MLMSPALRKLALVTHVTTSLGWFGAVAAFLALALAGLNSTHPELVRASYVAMNMIAWYVIVPLCLASLLSGIVQSLGTAWGLFIHYWVVIKLLITLIATVILLLHMRPIGHMAGTAVATTLAPGDMRDLRVQLTADAAAAIVVLVVATVLAVYKPQGLTPYGHRKLKGRKSARA